MEKPKALTLINNELRHFLPPQEVGRQLLNLFTNLNPHTLRMCNAFEMQKKIKDYRNKVALKHKRVQKKDISECAFIDISPMTERYNTENIHYEGVNKMYVNLNRTNTALLVNLHYTEKIQLPFDKCFIHAQLEEHYAMTIEIEDNKDGTYDGNFYTVLWDNQITIQSKFHIERVENHWEIQVKTEFNQRPFGGVNTNLISLAATVYNTFLSKNETQLKEFQNAMKKLELDTNIELFHQSYAASILDALLYLNAYKNKIVYKVSNKEANIFVYSNKLEQDTLTYINKKYPNCSQEKIDGWIVNGNWNFIKPTEYGKDRNGKPIKGLDWVIPFIHIENKELNSNKQSARIVPIHPIERAKERYSLSLTEDDLSSIADECLKGHATKLSVRDKFGKIHSSFGKEGCYRLKYKNKYLDVVLSSAKDGNSYRVATFLPAPKDIKYNIIDNKDYNTILKDI